jgi:serine/threonine protein kinase
MEYANAGNLDDYLALAQKHPLSEDDIWQIFIEILGALRHLHHAGIVHRDIKVRF